MLCDKCHQREAKVHLTFMLGEKMEKQDLCVVCAPTDEHRDDRCEFCGAPAVVGWESSILSADGTKHVESHFVCEQCQKERGTKRT